jgi:hypothetical protein
MDQITHSLEFAENCQIIGDKDQMLQVIFRKNDSITFKKQNLHFCSNILETGIYHQKSSFHTQQEGNKNDLTNYRVRDNNLLRVKNNSNAFCYIGLYSGGKIMKILPFLYHDLFIRYDCLLAFTDGLELLEIKEISNKINKYQSSDNFIHKDHKFYQIFSNKFSNNFDFDRVSIGDYHHIKEYCYLSNESLLIEKRLGKNEEIMIRKNSLVAFEKGVNFQKIFDECKHIQKEEYFIVEGPGLIIFELNHLALKKREYLKNLKVMIFFTFILFLIGTAHWLIETPYFQALLNIKIDG